MRQKNRYFAQKSFCFYFLIVRFYPKSEGEIVKHTSFEIKRNTRKFLISMQKKKYRKGIEANAKVLSTSRQQNLITKTH